VQEFVREYFDSNPISQLGVIVTRNAVADKVSELSSNPRKHADAIAAAVAKGTGGDMTIQGALDIAARTLALMPAYGTKEVVMIHGSLSTRDAGDIFKTTQALVKEKVRVSFISLPGEVYIASRISKDTGGTYGVPETYDALRIQLLAHCSPPPRRADKDDEQAFRAPMTRIGFPELKQEDEGMCACHRTLRGRGYICPRCKTRCCEVPSRCLVCDLHLLSAPSLARSYHHLFPVPLFTQVPSATEAGIRWLPKEPKPSTSGSSDSNAMEDAVPAQRSEGDDADDDDDDEDARIGLSSGGSAADEAALSARLRKRPHQLVRDASTHCGACRFPLPATQHRFVCPSCSIAVCEDCDALVHESLHNCPGCAGSGAGT
jgi:transcription initiation factor TFIIH subunit 2